MIGSTEKDALRRCLTARGLGHVRNGVWENAFTLIAPRCKKKLWLSRKFFAARVDCVFIAAR
jgi:hypothetical protein